MAARDDRTRDAGSQARPDDTTSARAKYRCGAVRCARGSERNTTHIDILPYLKHFPDR